MLSEKGQEVGREQFGDEHEAKLKFMLSTLRSNLPYLYGLSVTVLNTDFTSTIPKTLAFVTA